MDAYQNIDHWVPAFSGKRKTDDDEDTIFDNNDAWPVFPIQLTNTTGTYLEDLNEDCLLEIFSSNSLTPTDLCSLAEVCARFKQIIERMWPNKDYQLARKYPGYEFRSKNGTKYHSNLRGVERILKNFGSHLTKLVIWNKDLELVYLVGMYCGDATLNHLEISGLKSIEGVKTHMNSIFQRLRQLRVSNCDFLKDVTFQNLNFDSLIELNIDASQGCAVILEETFPNLERFSWNGSYVYMKCNGSNATHLYNFIARHRHLKTIDVCDGSVYKIVLLHVIDSTCKELEELRINSLSNFRLPFDFSNQGGFSKLKTLDFYFDCDDPSEYNAFLQALTSLETIKIRRVEQCSVEMIDVLSQLQNLRELHLIHCPFNQIRWKMLSQLRKVYLCGDYYEMDFVDMIRQLINLEDLEYFIIGGMDSYHYKLEKDEVADIVKIVERRENVLTLKFRFDFDLDEFCSENRKVKLISQNEFY